MLKNDHEGQVHKDCRKWPRHTWRFYLSIYLDTPVNITANVSDESQ